VAESSFSRGSGSEDVGWSLDIASFGSEEIALHFYASNFTKSCPTVTVSSSLTRNSFLMPVSGALTATSILSVSMVAIYSSCST
jgi:hypothetical protein